MRARRADALGELPGDEADDVDAEPRAARHQVDDAGGRLLRHRLGRRRHRNDLGLDGVAQFAHVVGSSSIRMLIGIGRAWVWNSNGASKTSFIPTNTGR